MTKQILVISVGCGALKILGRINEQMGEKFDYIAINSDEQKLKSIKTKGILFPRERRIFKNFSGNTFSNKLKHFCNFLFCPKPSYGCGGDAKIGEKLAQKYIYLLKNEFQKTEQVIILSAFGGGFGTGATPIIVDYIKQFNINLTAVITTPFYFEGKKRNNVAKKYIEKLKNLNENLIILHNDELIENIDKIAKISDALEISGNAVTKKLLEITEKDKKTDSNL